MKWYEDKEYQKMCEEAWEIQKYKFEKGWQEGDWVWDGKRVRVIGFDFIDLKYRQRESRYFKFAILQDIEPKITFEQKAPHDVIKAKTGTYKIIEICNPVWLPTQEDLQEIYCKQKTINWTRWFKEFTNFILILQAKFATETPAGCDSYKQGFGRIKKMWSLEIKAKLAFVMHELYQKKWNPEIENWEAEK